MGGREREAPLLLSDARVLDLQDAGRRLLLQPFARVPRVHAGVRGQIAGRERACFGQRAVQAQAVAQVDGEDVHRSHGRVEQPLDERVSSLIRAGHRPSRGRPYRRIMPSGGR